jgi:aspartate aminotransferase
MEGVERTLIRQIFDRAPPDAINLGLGQPDLPTPDAVALAGISGVVEGKTSYTTTAGTLALRTAVAREYAGSPCGPDNVVIHAGSQEALFATMLALIDPGDEVLHPDPGYPAYPAVARLLGGVPRPYPLRPERRFRLDPRDIGERLTERTRVVVLCSPGNPTGAVHREEDLRRVAEMLGSRGVPWISDEIYAAFTYDGPCPSIRSVAPDGGVVISGLSKSLSMTGWRIGWSVGPETILRSIVVGHQYVVTCAPSISQHAALCAFGAEGRAAASRHREIFRRRRALMAEELARIAGANFHLPDGAFYFFVDIRAFGDCSELSRRILEHGGVITIPGVAFGRGGEGFLRVSYAASDRDIIRGIRSIARVLQSTP